MQTISDIRRTNLRAVIDADFEGVPARLARAIGCQPTSISRLYSDAPSARNMGDKMARDIERVAGRPEGWMDNIHDTELEPMAKAWFDLTPAERQAALAFLDALKARRGTP
jgi:hypothetical protein